jgi:two-component system, OmpR family, response regulator
MIPQKVLIIEDEFLIRKTTCLFLNKEKIATVAASTGTEGISMAISEKPDLILLDLMLPDMDGWEVLRRLKADEGTRDLPVVFFSAADREVSDIEIRKRGAVGMLHKPFYPHQLFEIVKTL